MSNPGCLRLCPPASSQLISGDTSRRPDRELFYPENNPSHLPPQCKAAPHFLLYFLQCSPPPPPPPTISSLLLSAAYCLSFMSPSVFVKSYTPPVLSPSIFFLSFRLHPHFVSRYLPSVDENLWIDAAIANWGIACVSSRTHQHSRSAFYFTHASKVDGSLSPRAPLEMEANSQDRLSKRQGTVNMGISPSTAIMLKIVYFLVLNQSSGTLWSIFNVCTDC